MHLIFMLLTFTPAHDDFRNVASSKYKVREAAAKSLKVNIASRLPVALLYRDHPDIATRSAARGLLATYQRWYVDMGDMPWIDSLTPEIFECVKNEKPPTYLKVVGKEDWNAGKLWRNYLSETNWQEEDPMAPPTPKTMFAHYGRATQGYVNDLLRDKFHSREVILGMVSRMRQIDQLWLERTYPKTPPVPGLD